MRKNRSIKPKIRWKAKKSPDVWQDPHRDLEVQQALNVIRDKPNPPKPVGFGGFLYSVLILPYIFDSNRHILKYDLKI